MYSWRRLLLLWLLLGTLPVQPLVGDCWPFACFSEAHVGAPLYPDGCQHDQDNANQPPSKPLHCPNCLLGMAIFQADSPDFAGKYRALFLAPPATLPVQPYFELLRPPRG